MKIKIVLTMFFAMLLLVGCTNETNNPIDNENPEACEIGYNESFEMCVEPILSEDNFTEFDINIDNEYNLGGQRMINNLLYNYISSTLDFDISFITDEDVKEINITVKNKNNNMEIYYKRLYFDSSTAMNLNSNFSFYQSLNLEGLVLGNEYQVIIEYTYAISNNIVDDRVLAGFTIDTSSLAGREGPSLSMYEIVEATTNSFEIKFKIIYHGNDLTNLEVRVYDAITGVFTGVSWPLTDLEPYKEQYVINIPSVFLDGLKSNCLYNIRIYGSGSNLYDEYENVLLFSGDELNNHLTYKFYYERDSMHFFHFGLEGLFQQDTGVLLSYDFVDERDTMPELESYQAPVYFRIKNANGYNILEIELDSSETGYLIPQDIFDEANIIDVYYQNSKTKQYVTLIVFGVSSMPVE